MHISKENEGQYLCEAKNNIGTGVSKVIFLKVNGKYLLTKNCHSIILPSSYRLSSSTFCSKKQTSPSGERGTSSFAMFRPGGHPDGDPVEAGRTTHIKRWRSALLNQRANLGGGNGVGAGNRKDDPAGHRYIFVFGHQRLRK